MIDIDTPVYFTTDDGRYRITVSYDSDTDSPRTWTNGTIMHTFDSRWNSPDGKVCDDPRHRAVHPLIPSEYVEGGRVDMRRARRWVNLFADDILDIVSLHRGHDGTLSFDRDTDDAEGYAVITQDSWAETMGGSEPFHVENADEMIAGEISVYNTWANGEFTSYLVEREQGWQAVDSGGNVVEGTMTSWEFEGAVGGFDDDEYAFSEAVDSLPPGAERED
jgi:hypothetical protein